MLPGSFFKRAFIYASLISLAGCAGPAIDAMNNAHQAMEVARQAEAERYASVAMTLAITNYEMARDNIIMDTRGGNQMARRYAIEAEAQARRAESEARIAHRDELKRREREYEKKKKKEEEANRLNSSVELEARRYVALAHRRLRFAAISKMGARPPRGFVEIEVWIAPTGTITQILIIEGDPESLLTRSVMHGIRETKMDPFPAAITRKYLKLRLTIDTRR